MDPIHGSASPSERLRSSAHHDAFLQHNQQTRDLDGARRLLGMEWRYLAPLIGDRKDYRVLDLACGSGTQAQAWAERGARVIGIDFDQVLLAHGRDRLIEQTGGDPHRPAWAAGNATSLPFAAETFDVVFCNSLLEHVPEWERVLAEASRVTRPGGILVIYTTNRHCPLQQEVRSFPFYSWLPDAAKRRVMAWIMEHRRDLVNYTDFPAVNWFTFPGMRRALQTHGFEAYDRIDLTSGSGRRAAVARLLTKWSMLKSFYYLYAISMAMYGVRSSGSPGAAR